MTSEEEHALIAELPQNAEAFRRLYSAYFSRIFAYVAHRVGRRQDAEDITADVFMRVVEKINQFEYRGEGSFAAWLFRIAYNHVQQFYRQQNTQGIIAMDDLPDIQSRGLSPDEALMRKEQFSRLHAMIATLSPRRQEVLSLKFFGELRNQEIAEILGLDERTIASHLCRGLEDLQQKYQQKDICHE